MDPISLKAIRSRISGMNTTQLVQFFAGFDDKNLIRISKAQKKVVDGQAQRQVEAKQKAIAKLQAEIEALQG